jgi:hypothetical protein
MNRFQQNNSDKGLTLTGKGAAALAVGLGLGVCGAQQADAVVIHSSAFGFSTVTLEADAGNPGFNSHVLDINNDGTDDLAFHHNYEYFTGAPTSVYHEAYILTYGLNSAVGHFEFVGGGEGNAGVVDNLSPGDVVGPSSNTLIFDSFFPGFLFADNYSYYGALNFGEFQGQDGFVGIVLDGDGPGVAEVGAQQLQDLYGWIRVGVSDDLSVLTIYEFAYEDSGEQIAIPEQSEVPIPSSLVLLASGAAGAAALRRRKKK